MYTHYHKAAKREQAIVRKLRAQGYIAVRSAGSHSPVDIWAIHPDKKIVLLLQHKGGKVTNSQIEKLNKGMEKLNGNFLVIFEVVS